MNIVKAILVAFSLFTISDASYAMQPCMVHDLTKAQAIKRFDNIVVVRVKSSLDETESFLETAREKFEGTPEEFQKELDKLDETVFRYITYKAEALESFKGSLEGEITLAEQRMFGNFMTSTLITGFYYILGLDNAPSNNAILMPACTKISTGSSRFDGDFLDKVDQFREANQLD